MLHQPDAAYSNGIAGPPAAPFLKALAGLTPQGVCAGPQAVAPKTNREVKRHFSRFALQVAWGQLVQIQWQTVNNRFSRSESHLYGGVSLPYNHLLFPIS